MWELYESLALRLREYLLLRNHVLGRQVLTLASERRSLGICIQIMFLCLCSFIQCHLYSHYIVICLAFPHFGGLAVPRVKMLKIIP